jgi:Icc protein
MTHHDDHDADRFDAEGNTRPKGGNFITTDQSDDGVDRRGFLRCMAWAGTATVWGMVGGIPRSFAVSRLGFMSEAERKSIIFVQISDSHI